MHPRTPKCVLFLTYTKLQSIYLFEGALTCLNLEKKTKKLIFLLRPPGTQKCKRNIDLVDLHWKLRLLCLIYTTQIRNHYFKPENKTDNSDFTRFGMKISPVPDLHELPLCRPYGKKHCNVTLCMPQGNTLPVSCLVYCVTSVSGPQRRSFL